MENTINLKLQVWRQESADSSGDFHYYSMEDVPVDISFLEMLDILNQPLLDTHDTALYNTLMDFDRKRKLNSREVFPELYKEKI